MIILKEHRKKALDDTERRNNKGVHRDNLEVCLLLDLACNHSFWRSLSDFKHGKIFLNGVMDGFVKIQLGDQYG